MQMGSKSFVKMKKEQTELSPGFEAKCEKLGWKYSLFLFPPLNASDTKGLDITCMLRNMLVSKH